MSKLYVNEIHPKTDGEHIRFPERPVFHAYNLAVTAANIDLKFTSVTINKGNCYSSDTGKFTAPVDGVYVFNFQVFHGVSVQYAVAYKNGTALPESNYSSYENTADARSTPCNLIIELVKGDVISIRNVTGSNLGSGPRNTFNGYLLF